MKRLISKNILSFCIAASVQLVLFCVPLFGGQGPLDLSPFIRQMQSDIATRGLLASPLIKDKLSAVPTVTAPEIHAIQAPPAPTKTIQVVSNAQKNRLISAVGKFVTEKKTAQQEFSRLAIALIVAGATLALLGSIFSFLKWNRTAGIVSLVVVAVVSAPNVYPVPALADFYGSLATQAIALQTDCELKDPFTVDDYSSSESQLKLLILYEADHRPGIGSAKTSTEDLARKLQAFKTDTNIANSVRE